MIIKKIVDKKNSIKKVIFSTKKNSIFNVKVDKVIEIVVVPNPGKKNSHQENVGIIIEEARILAYQAIKRIKWSNGFYRNDIGKTSF